MREKRDQREFTSFYETAIRVGLSAARYRLHHWVVFRELERERERGEGKKDRDRKIGKLDAAYKEEKENNAEGEVETENRTIEIWHRKNTSVHFIFLRVWRRAKQGHFNL